MSKNQLHQPHQLMDSLPVPSRPEMAALAVTAAFAAAVEAGPLASASSAQEGATAANIHYVTEHQVNQHSASMRKNCNAGSMFVDTARNSNITPTKRGKPAIIKVTHTADNPTHESFGWTLRKGYKLCGAMAMTGKGTYFPQLHNKTKKGGEYKDPAAYGDINNIKTFVLWFKKAGSTKK